jgi:NitT/TauT family transport system substrate-binding protein
MIGKIEVKPFRTSALPTKEEVAAAVLWASNKGLCDASLSYDQMVYDVYTK